MRRIIMAFIIGIGCGFTPKAFEMARGYRGYDAIGGEALIIPLAILIAAVVYCVSGTWRDFFWDSKAEVAGEAEEEETDHQNVSEGGFTQCASRLAKLNLKQ